MTVCWLWRKNFILTSLGLSKDTHPEHAVPNEHNMSSSPSPSTSELIAAYAAPHTHSQRLAERRQSVRPALPRVSTSMYFLTAAARGHHRWMEIIVHHASISAYDGRSRSLPQHTTSTDSLTLGLSPAMAAGIAFPLRNSLSCPPPPEFPICVQADIDKVLEVVVVAHVIYQSRAVVDVPWVE